MEKPVDQINDEIAGKAAYARFRWTSDNGMTPYIFWIHKYAYAFYFISAFALIAFFVYHKYLTLYETIAITSAVSIAPIALPVIQWTIYKMGLLAMGVIGGKVSPQMRDKYPVWIID